MFFLTDGVIRVCLFPIRRQPYEGGVSKRGWLKQRIHSEGGEL